MKPSEDLYTTIRPTLYLARLYGVVPFSFEKKEILKPAVFITVVVASYYFYGVTQVYISMFNNPILPKFEKMMLILQVCASSSVTITTWIANHFRFRKLILLFERLKNVESLLVSLGMEINIKPRKKVQYHFICWIAFFSLQNVFDNVILGENILSLNIIYTIAMLTLSHFLLLTLICRQYYTFINNKLKSVGELSPEGLTDIIRLTNEILPGQWATLIVPFHQRPAIVNTLKTMMECHSELFVVCNGLNKYFGLQVLLNITANILNVTSICYYVPAIVIDESDKPHHYMIISIKSVTFMAIFAFLQLWVVARICSTTSDEVSSSS